MKTRLQMEEKALLEQLKQAVLDKFGYTNLSVTDCKALAAAIQKHTKERLSENTLKRVWGLIQYEGKPARGTLDVLCRYVGHDNWGEFVAAHQVADEGGDTWGEMRQKAREASLRTVSYIHHKAGAFSYDKVPRVFATNNIRTFLGSGAVATALVAPGGYGKSTALAMVYETLWEGNNPDYPQDMVWFVDATQILAEHANTDLDTWLYKQTGQHLLQYFSDFPAQRKGRIVLIIDSLDELNLPYGILIQFYKHLAGFINQCAALPWFKLILSTRSSVWKKNIFPVIQTHNRRELWYGVQLESYNADLNNVPLLTEAEVMQVIKNFTDLQADAGLSAKWADLHALIHTFTPRLKRLLSIPYYLQIFLTMYASGIATIEDELDLILAFLQNKVFQAPEADPIIVLMEQMLQLCNYGLNGDSINKMSLLSYIDKCPAAYAHLLNYGILREEQEPNQYMGHSYRVSFGHRNLFEVYLALQLAQKKGGLDTDLLNQICIRYANSELRLYLLRWLVILAFKEKNYVLLRSVFDLQLNLNNAHYMHIDLMELNYAIGLQLRHDAQARAELIPYYAAHPVAQTYYFEQFVDIDYLVLYHHANIAHYLQHKKTPEAQLFGQCLLFLKALLTMDTKGCMEAYKHIIAIPIHGSTIHPFPIGRAMAVRLLYQHFHGPGVTDELLNEIAGLEKQMPRSGDRLQNFPCFHVYVMEAFNLCGLYDSTLALAKIALADYPELNRYQDFYFHSMFNLYRAEALFHTGDETEAEKLMDDLVPDKFYFDTRQYLTVQYLLLKARLLAAKNQLTERSKVLARCKAICKELGYVFYERLCDAQISKAALKLETK